VPDTCWPKTIKAANWASGLAHQKHSQAAGVVIMKTLIKKFALTEAVNMLESAAQHGN
jgi:hypothetical protein